MNTLDHVSKAERNQHFYSKNSIEGSSFPEWAIVVLFYTLLHYIDAVLARESGWTHKDRNPTNHTRRSIAVWKCNALQPIADKYDQLYDVSILARYKHIAVDYRAFKKARDSLYRPALSHVKQVLARPQN